MGSPEKKRLTAGWLPAHPSSGSHSMRRYWEALANCHKEQDRYDIHSIITPVSRSPREGRWGQMERYIQRRVGYPLTIKLQFQGEIAHILDHSWADLLTFIPRNSLRIVTVHDLIPLRFPGGLNAAQVARFRTWVSHSGSAHAIIADSEYTKQEIVDLLQLPPDNIYVVPCGVDLPRQADFTSSWIEERISSANPSNQKLVIGSIGSTIERKNLAIFPQALATYVSLTGAQPILVRAGGKLQKTLADEIRHVIGANNFLELGFLKDEELGNFYRSVNVVVVPSYYEGFGLPVLEAMASKVPVISSRASSLPEVGGKEAIYFDPQSPEELGHELATLAKNGISDDWLDRAYERAARYSWRASLEGVYSVYDAALDIRAKRA